MHRAGSCRPPELAFTCAMSPRLDCYHNHPVTLPRPDTSPPRWGVAGWAHEASPRGPGSNREGSPSVNLGRRSALPLWIFHDLLGSLAIPLKPPTSLGIVGARIDGRIFHRPPLSTPRPLSTLTLPRGQLPDFYGEFAPSVSASMVQGIPSLEAHPWGPHSYWGRIPPSLSPPRTLTLLLYFTRSDISVDVTSPHFPFLSFLVSSFFFSP